MKIFLDTNVLASAFTTRGLCADVLREILASHELYTSVEVLDELQNVLKKKLEFPESLIKDILSFLRREAVNAHYKESLDINIKDKADIPIMSAALAAGVHLFVTGDKELHELARIRNLIIVSPRKLWELLKNR